jgi:hypothetical protein
MEFGDWCEELNDDNKKFPSGVFSKDFGKGVRNYIYVNYHFDGRSFVIAEEQYTEEELSKLASLCECDVCTASYLSLLRYVGCPCCYGCITAGIGYARKDVVEQAREKLARINTTS